MQLRLQQDNDGVAHRHEGVTPTWRRPPTEPHGKQEGPQRSPRSGAAIEWMATPADAGQWVRKVRRRRRTRTDETRICGRGDRDSGERERPERTHISRPRFKPPKFHERTPRER